MKTNHWVSMNSEWIRDEKLCDIKWLTDSYGKPSSKLAALMIYIVINMYSQKDVRGSLSTLTYNQISNLTGLSRSLISNGTKTLVALKLIELRREGRKNEYIIFKKDLRYGGWCKLPCSALLNIHDEIAAFKFLTLRSKVELHALKMYLYLVSIRDNNESYSIASFEKISKKAGISIGDIAKAKTLLVAIGLIVNVTFDLNYVSKKNEPTKYYLIGHSKLNKKRNY